MQMVCLDDPVQRIIVVIVISRSQEREREIIGRIILNLEQIDRKREQAEDLLLRKFFLTKEGHHPDWQEIISKDDSAKIYWSQWKSLSLSKLAFFAGNGRLLT